MIRRSLFLVVLALLVLLLSYLFEWLTEKQQQARQMRPPLKTERSVPPDGAI